jgi:NAD(P)-dependent dehydrogenase (short-subunit alcohol dehydrogenase family)
MLLKNRVAIVTGGAKGMGRGIAYKLAEEGCTVAISDIDMKEAAVTVAEIEKKGAVGLAIQCDVTKEPQVKAVVDQVIARFGKIDILVNNAGGERHSPPVENITEEWWDKTMDLNLKSVFFFCKYVVPHMKAKKYGKIISISSMGGTQPPAHVIDYNTAKAAIVGFTTDLATALAPLGINVNAISPGPVQTHFYDATIGNMNDQQKAAFFTMLGKQVPLGRVGLPEDIGNAVVFLGSEMGSWITGLNLILSGGLPLKTPGPPPSAMAK